MDEAGEEYHMTVAMMTKASVGQLHLPLSPDILWIPESCKGDAYLSAEEFGTCCREGPDEAA